MWVICIDTVCDGYTCTCNEDDKPVLFATEKEALDEIASDPEFYNDDDFVCKESEIGYKSVWFYSKNNPENSHSCVPIKL